MDALLCPVGAHILVYAPSCRKNLSCLHPHQRQRTRLERDFSTAERSLIHPLALSLNQRTSSSGTLELHRSFVRTLSPFQRRVLPTISIGSSFRFGCAATLLCSSDINKLLKEDFDLQNPQNIFQIFVLH